MPTRTIKTVDGTEHSGDSSDFTDYYSHVEYRDSSETKVIYRNNIIYDATTKNWNETMMPLKIGVVAGIITFLLLWFALVKLTGSVQAQLPTAEQDKPAQVAADNSQSKPEPVAEDETQKTTSPPQKATEKETPKAEDKTQKLEQELQKFLEQEKQELFDQEYIDPLTDYIIKHQKDSLRKSYVQDAKTERDRRCDEVEKRFQKQPKNYLTLAKLTKGYNYSCPEVVNRFAKGV